MLVITDAEARRFVDSLTEREHSPATISKYAHDLRLLTDYAPDGIPEKAALVGFRAYLTERGYAPTSVNSILGAVNVFFELLGLDWRLKYLPIHLESGEATILNDEFIILLWAFTFSEKRSNPWENAKLYRVKIHENVPDCQAPSPCL